MHDLDELAFFQDKWARMWPVVCLPLSSSCPWRCNPVCKLQVSAKVNEGKATREAYYTGIEAPLAHQPPDWLGRHFKCLNPVTEGVSVHFRVCLRASMCR